MKLIRNYRRKPCSAYTEEELLAMIRQGAAAMEKAMDCLYEQNFDMARHALQQHNLTEDEVLEVYADTLLAIRDNIWAGRFEQRGTLRAFLGMTFRNKCIDKIRRNATKQKREDDVRKNQVEEEAPTPYGLLEQQEADEEKARASTLRKFCLDLALKDLGDRDRQIITDYFVRDMKTGEIAEKYGFKTTRVVSTTIYNLKGRLEEAIQKVCKSDTRCAILCSSPAII